MILSGDSVRESWGALREKKEEVQEHGQEEGEGEGDGEGEGEGEGVASAAAAEAAAAALEGAVAAAAAAFGVGNHDGGGPGAVIDSTMVCHKGGANVVRGFGAVLLSGGEDGIIKGWFEVGPVD